MPKPSTIPLQHHRQEHSASCLAACVVMILSHWQVTVAEAEVSRILKTRPYAGAHPINLMRLGELGFLGCPFDGTSDDLRRQVSSGVPVIAFLWTGALRYWRERGGIDYQHVVVVVGWDETSVWIHDPALPEGPVKILWSEFNEAWWYTCQMMAPVEPQ